MVHTSCVLKIRPLGGDCLLDVSSILYIEHNLANKAGMNVGCKVVWERMLFEYNSPDEKGN